MNRPFAHGEGKRLGGKCFAFYQWRKQEAFCSGSTLPLNQVEGKCSAQRVLHISSTENKRFFTMKCLKVYLLPFRQREHWRHFAQGVQLPAANPGFLGPNPSRLRESSLPAVGRRRGCSAPGGIWLRCGGIEASPWPEACGPAGHRCRVFAGLPA